MVEAGHANKKKQQQIQLQLQQQHERQHTASFWRRHGHNIRFRCIQKWTITTTTTTNRMGIVSHKISCLFPCTIHITVVWFFCEAILECRIKTIGMQIIDIYICGQLRLWLRIEIHCTRQSICAIRYNRVIVQIFFSMWTLWNWQNAVVIRLYQAIRSIFDLALERCLVSLAS